MTDTGGGDFRLCRCDDKKIAAIFFCTPHTSRPRPPDIKRRTSEPFKESSGHVGRWYDRCLALLAVRGVNSVDAAS